MEELNSDNTIDIIPTVNVVPFDIASTRSPSAFGFTWKRSNAQGGMAGMLAGILTAVIWYVLKQPFGWMPILPAIFTSTAANILVSLMTPAPPKETVDEFFGKKDRIEEEPEKKFADAAGTGVETCGQM